MNSESQPSLKFWNGYLIDIINQLPEFYDVLAQDRKI